MWMDNWVLNTPLEFWPHYKNNKSPVLFRFFETQRQVVVLSSSNRPEKEVNVELCHQLNIPILRRRGGGGTVVLGSGCLVLTFAFYAKDVFSNSKYFDMINRSWINSLQAHVPVTLSLNGISDICCQDKKIAGTSIFRKKHLLVYQGSMLVRPDLNQIHELLLHPSKEPDYRKGRSHEDFLTTLHSLGCKQNASQLANHCQNYFDENVLNTFKNEFY